MTVIDINTRKVIYTSPNLPEHVFWATKEYWEKYVKEVTEWGKELERKLLYGKYEKTVI
jgi:hypothetical protein